MGETPDGNPRQVHIVRISHPCSGRLGRSSDEHRSASTRPFRNCGSRLPRLRLGLRLDRARCSVPLRLQRRGPTTSRPSRPPRTASLAPQALVAVGRQPARHRRHPERPLPLRRSQRRRTGSARFAIAADGTLTPVAGSPFPVGLNPNWSRSAARVASSTSPTSAATRSRSSRSARTAVSARSARRSPTQDGPQALAFSPNGQFLFVPNFGSSSISAFAVGGDGTLSAGSRARPFPAQAVPSASNAVVAPAAPTSTWVAGPGNAIHAFTIGANGTLAQIPGSPFPATTPEGLAFNSEGSTLYAANNSGNLIQSATPSPATASLDRRGDDADRRRPDWPDCRLRRQGPVPGQHRDEQRHAVHDRSWWSTDGGGRITVRDRRHLTVGPRQRVRRHR